MTTQPARRGSWVSRTGRAGLFIIAALVAIALLGRAAWGYVEARRLQAEAARIHDAGEPLTFEQLDALSPKVAERDDAGPYYEAALALVRAPHRGSAPQSRDAYRAALAQSPASHPSPDVVADVEQLLADNALALDMLDRGAGCSGCRFTFDAELGLSHVLPPLSAARALAQLAALRSEVRASAGDGDGAADSLVALLRMSRICDRQPLIVASLVKVACRALAHGDVPIVLELGQPSEAGLLRLQEAILAAGLPNELERTMLTERVYGLGLMRYLVTGSGATDLPADVAASAPEQWLPAGFWLRPMQEHLATGYLQDMVLFVQAARRPLTDVLRTGETDIGARSMLGRMLGGSWTALCEQVGRATAGAECAATAIMVHRYRLANGRLPATLSELVPTFADSVPIDPYTGHELLYRSDARSYVVYSVGENRKDDGGTIEAPAGKRPADDGIRVRLPTTP